MEPLPVERIVAGLPQALADAKRDWLSAAEAIMTTDTVPKAFSREDQHRQEKSPSPASPRAPGMIRPNMATMLGFVATDAAVAQSSAARCSARRAERSFNCITVDGDTSTNDSFVLIATACRPRPIARQVSRPGRAGRGGHRRFATTRAGHRPRRRGRDQVRHRARGGRARARPNAAASPMRIAHSPLVKTAFFASDPNLGRILAAIGYAGVDSRHRKDRPVHRRRAGRARAAGAIRATGRSRPSRA